MFRVPDAEVPEVGAILATSHEKWMRATHQGPAEPSPLVYTIKKAAELKNPLDPSEGTTGHTIMALTEVYRGSKEAKRTWRVPQVGRTLESCWKR